MLEYSGYPEAADDSIVADDNTVPAGNVTYVAAPPPSYAAAAAEQQQQQQLPSLMDDEEEDYDEEEIRQLDHRSGRSGCKGTYVIMAILFLVAIAAIASGSTFIVMKKRNDSIEAAKQSANSRPPRGGVSVSPAPTPAPTPTLVGTILAPTVNETQGNITDDDGEGSLGSNLTDADADSISAGTTSSSSSNGTTTGIGATEENDITEFAEFDVLDGATEGGSVDVVDGDTEDNVGDFVDSSSTGSSSSGSDGVGVSINGGTGGSSGSSTTDGEGVGSDGVFDGEVNDSNVVDGSGVLPGESGGDVTDSSTASSPEEDITVIDESGGGSNQVSSGITIVDVDDSSGLTDGIGGNVTATADSSECAIGGKCSEEGAVCAIGEETCCGQTFNSIECECSGGEWLCMATDACNRPDCGDLNTNAPSAAPLTPPPSSTIVAPQATPSLVPTSRFPSASPTLLPTSSFPSASPTLLPTTSFPSASPIPSSEPTCSIYIEVNFVTEEQGNLDNTGYTLMSAEGSDSITYMETLPGDLINTTSQYDVACVPSGGYIFTVDDDTSKCCGVNKGYYAVKINGEEVVRERSHFISPHAFIIRADYQPPIVQTKIQWLDKHNDVREQFHTQNGVSFRPLVWSDSLATAAAERANDIATTCGISSGTMDPWGENIGRTKFGVYNEAYVSPDYVFGGWNNFENHPLTYWQIMWRPTRFVGCATNITLQTDGRYCHVAVCKYTRPHCNVNNENWLNQTLEDYSMCGPSCPSEGCY